MVVDPVCRMQVEEDKAAAMTVHDGKSYYFCCQGCKEKFQQDPQRYLEALKQSVNPANQSKQD